MFQNNPVLIKLKKKLCAKTVRVEGTVKSNKKGFGFLDIDKKNSYFIKPIHMKKVMHGDKVIAKIHKFDNKESVEPEKLITPFLHKFVGKVIYKKNKLFVLPDYFCIKKPIMCILKKKLSFKLQNEDWVMSKLLKHPLRDNNVFCAEIIDFVSKKNNTFSPWLVTLSKYNLNKKPPKEKNVIKLLKNEELNRKDLTKLNFFTIDSMNTKDIDDAFFIKKINNIFYVTVAIADPTAYISPNSKLDISAMNRGYTNYLPGFNVPMLPRYISENICSLKPNVKRPVLACSFTVLKNGDFVDNKINFYLAWIKSKAKLIYENVSNWLENTGSWKPKNENIKKQIKIFYEFCNVRFLWRKRNALIFKNTLEYRFQLNDKYEVLGINIESRRIAHRIVEEAMLSANICAANYLNKKLGFGIYNVHNGFDKNNSKLAALLLSSNGFNFNEKDFLNLNSFCQIHRIFDFISDKYVYKRFKKLQSFVEISNVPSPHFALGLNFYATWTSPIRKYSDMINHRLIKSVIRKIDVDMPNNKILSKIIENKRKIRMSEKDIQNWLYVIFLKKVEGKKIFLAEIIDVFKSGLRVKIIKNGAYAFIPTILIHNMKNEVFCNYDNGSVYIKNKLKYKISDLIKIKIFKVKIKNRNIIAKIY
ncbi:exoribonuclease II [Buchnera aphidicola (Taiwanaphis decaspermi)]|uniref:exoribonuclease II n=1 Tax=Buchnera aphidicola TaxID=9 RepID=UPI0031B7FECC